VLQALRFRNVFMPMVLCVGAFGANQSHVADRTSPRLVAPNLRVHRAHPRVTCG
jgi:hypothetical protein